MTDNLRGILAMVGGATAFALNDAITKLVTAELPPGELIVIRGSMATVLILCVAWVRGALSHPRVLLAWPMALRVVVAAISTTFIVLALKYLPLAIVSALLQAAPVIVTVVAALVYREVVGWRRWLATAAGFIGVLLVIQPGSPDASPYMFLAILALIFTTTRDLITRLINPAVSSLFVAGASSALITMLGLAFLPFEKWVIPSPRAVVLLALCSVCLLFAYTLFVVAMRTGQMSVVAPFRYTVIPLVVAIGYVGWGDLPNEMASLGIAVVIASGLYMLSLERRPRELRPGYGDPIPRSERPIT